MEDKLKEIFSIVFGLDKSRINDDFSPQNHEEWDSVTHLVIITEIEAIFGITFDEMTIPELDSFKKMRDELKKLMVEGK